MATSPTNDIAIIATEDTNSDDYSTTLTPRDEIFSYGFQVAYVAYEELNYLFKNHGLWLDYLNDLITENTDDLQDQITSNDEDIANIQSDISTLQTDIAYLEGEIGTTSGDSTFVTALFEGFFPVGTIYQNDTETDSPDSYLLGATDSTWEAIEARFIIGAGTNTDDNSTSMTFTAQDTGGEFTHTITTDEMPTHSHTYSGTVDSAGAHTHNISIYRSDNDGSSQVGVGYSNRYGTGATQSAGAHTHTFSGTTDTEGGDTAMNLLPNYYVSYIWRRTA